MNPGTDHYEFSPGRSQAQRLLLLGVLLLAFFACRQSLFGAAAPGEGSDVIDSGSILESPARAAVYGLGFLGLCLLSIFVPDAPLLLLICSMPIAQFSGARVGLTVLQCGIVCLRRWGVRDVVPSWPLLVFLVCIVASASWALNPAESLFGEEVGVVAMLLQLPLALAARALLHAQLTTVRRMLWALTAGCVPGCGLVIYNALAGIRYAAGGDGYYMGFIPPDIFSPMLVMCGAFLLFCVTARTVTPRARLLAGALLPLIGLGLLLSGIRSGWIAFSFCALVMLVLTRNWMALAGLFGAGLAAIALWFSVGRMLHLEDQLSSRLSEGSLHTGEMRLQYWQVAARGFIQRPILGIGWGGFPGFAADNTVGREAATHNIFVRILCELGFVGLVTFACWVAGILLRLRHSPERSLVGLLMLGVLLQGLLLDHFVCSYFWLFLGICDGAGYEPGYKSQPVEELERLTPGIRAAAT